MSVYDRKINNSGPGARYGPVKQESETMTLYQLRRQFETLKRKYAHVIAKACLLPVANQITELWNIAAAKKQPKPDPLSCVRRAADAGFRLRNFNVLHGYFADCRHYGSFPDALEIVHKVFPPGKRVNLSDVLPGHFPVG